MLTRAAGIAALFTAAAAAALALASVSRADDHLPIFDPGWRFTCPPEQTSSCMTPPLREGSDCRFDLLDGADDLAARLESIDRAKKSIRIQSLIFRGDESGRYIADKLIEKKKANPNMKIQVIVDATSNFDPRSFEMYQALKANHIEVIGTPMQLVDDFVQPSSVAFKRFHEKLWVVDGEDPDNAIAITGGLNIGNQYFRLGPNADKIWRDQDTIERGAVAQDAMRAFDGNFTYLSNNISTVNVCLGVIPHTDVPYRWTSQALHEVKKLMGKSDPITEVIKGLDKRHPDLNATLEPAKCRFIDNRPRFNENYIRDAYLELIRSSDKEIRIENAYFIPPPEVIQALRDAVKAGKKIKIITNSYETNDIKPITTLARKLYYEMLSANETPEARKNGGSIQIYEWQGKRRGENQSEGTLHAKFAVGGQQSLIVGSYNLDNRSDAKNSESALVAESATRARKLINRFDTGDLAKSEEIGLEQARAWYEAARKESVIQKGKDAVFRDEL